MEIGIFIWKTMGSRLGVAGGSVYAAFGLAPASNTFAFCKSIPRRTPLLHKRQLDPPLNLLAAPIAGPSAARPALRRCSR